MKPSCTGCRDLRLETWPKGVRAARCFSERAPAGSIDHRGRVVELYQPEANLEAGPMPRIPCPMWCPRGDPSGPYGQGGQTTETGERNGKTDKPPL